MLSDASKVFDPLGWLSPTTIMLKIKLQELWLSGLSWDDKLPNNIKETWVKLQEQLIHVEHIRIPRWLNIEANLSYELHGFCDASNKAYAAVIFSRIKTNDAVKTHLIIAKTRVSPIKTISMPRLELCVALLLARLFKLVLRSLVHPPTKLTAWTDSTIVLAWLQSNPCKWKCFVANRTSEILNIISSEHWRHISSHENPADCASRGLYADELVSHSLWWHGPTWLNSNEQFWPAHNRIPANTEIDIRPNINTLTVSLPSYWELIDRFSSLEKLLRITSLIIRFTATLRNIPRNTDYVTASEMRKSLTILIMNVQQSFFSTELNSLTDRKQVAGKLRNFNPFVDSMRLLRVGGRLQNSNLHIGQKHPIILPPNSQLTSLLIDHAHCVTLHGGMQLVLNYLHQNYWIVNGKRAVRNVINKCLICFRHRIKGRQQLMGQLPPSRVNPSRPFTNSGVDFTGPITIKFRKGRGAKTTKGYIAVFVCMAVKAVHLEVVSQLTSDAFIAAFKRFTLRRGLIRNLFSDNGTNFVGANTILRAQHQKCLNCFTPEITEMLACDGTEWHFIPPSSPHFGGLWEAGVKSVKHHLIRTIKDRLLTFEEITTVVTQIEACLNSRPICPIASDPENYEALSPSHFLIGENILTVPEPNLLDIDYSRRWTLVQLMYQQFWQRWSRDYLNRLQQRPKCHKIHPNITPGQLVIVIHDNKPPSKWSLGRVIQTHPRKDGIVRVATVKSASGEYKRSIVKLCPLPFDSSGNDSE